MKKNTVQIVVAVIAVILIGLLLLWSLSPKEPISSSQSNEQITEKVSGDIPSDLEVKQPNQNDMTNSEEQNEVRQKKFMAAFNTPINFWGMVVDEKGNPVDQAIIKLGTADIPWKKGSDYERETDVNGLFSITGVKGLSISINVSKEGYYQTPNSRKQLSYAQPSGNKEPLPTPDKPVMFELRKKGDAEPLIKKEGFIKIARNGVPVGFDLESGKKVSADNGDIKVEAWTSDQQKDEQGHYNWRCKITVPGGGLIEREEQFDFEAPENGYNQSVEIEMPADAENWRPQVARQYFVQLPGNRYGRIQFEMIAGGDHFFSITSHFNPSGSRNLEYDPSLAVNP